jgi:hypothetical protein
MEGPAEAEMLKKRSWLRCVPSWTHFLRQEKKIFGAVFGLRKAQSDPQIRLVFELLTLCERRLLTQGAQKKRHRHLLRCRNLLQAQFLIKNRKYLKTFFLR